jgi:cobalt-zinc-cadmium efflux system membrane fusion protein
LLFSIAAIGVAVGLGFAAGQWSQSSVKSVPQAAPAASAAALALPTTIALSAPELTNLQLQIEQARTGPLQRTVSATGTVGYDLLHVAHIKPPARGRIETLDVTVGGRVVAGQRLAVLDNFELGESGQGPGRHSKRRI